jgi:hypothetical protein
MGGERLMAAISTSLRGVAGEQPEKVTGLKVHYQDRA